jgi:outer membrane protein assembly factor BamE (lipoprotein component of BamABCDE complex)
MPHFRSVVAGILWLLLAGCSTVQFGHDFDPRQFDAKVERGVTSREVVRTWLGAPAASGVAVDAHGERLEEWTYYYGHGTLPSMQDTQLKILQIKFDPQGRVYSYSWTGEPAK